MRKNQCKFCFSRKCYHRIVTIDLSYDEIACSRHSRELEVDADKVVPGALKCHIESTGPVMRGEDYPCKAMEPNQDHLGMGHTSGGGYVMFCLHCGERYMPVLPVALDKFSEACTGFMEKHKWCQVGETTYTTEQMLDV